MLLIGAGGSCHLLWFRFHPLGCRLCDAHQVLEFVPVFMVSVYMAPIRVWRLCQDLWYVPVFMVQCMENPSEFRVCGRIYGSGHVQPIRI